MDTRYLMYHYSGKPLKEKVALAECIEVVLGRGPLPTVGAAVTPIAYEVPEIKPLIVAEDSTP